MTFVSFTAPGLRTTSSSAPNWRLLAARFSNIDVSFVCSQEGSAWQGPTGRIDGPMLLRLAPDLHQRTLYLCGPEPFMRTVRACLAEIG
ncbi:MAG: hypothetical protein E5Y18_00080, partial [Mesorhizobium sp.]